MNVRRFLFKLVTQALYKQVHHMERGMDRQGNVWVYGIHD